MYRTLKNTFKIKLHLLIHLFITLDNKKNSILLFKLSLILLL